jgi:hypothetical protein
VADEEVVLPVGRDSAQGAVELSVAAAVEPVASVFTGARFEWCEAGGAGKVGWVREVSAPDETTFPLPKGSSSTCAGLRPQQQSGQS